MTMLAVPHLIKTKGSIVNVSSVTGVRSVSILNFSRAIDECIFGDELLKFKVRCIFFRNFYTKFVIIIYCSLSSPFINAYLACMLHNLSFVYIVRIALYSFISFSTIRTSSFYCFQFGGVLPYCVSKSALDQFTRCIAIGRCSLL